MKIRQTVSVIVLIAFIATGCTKKDPGLPNILWITSEDNSPMLGCYGDEFATTPYLDQLASEGFRYTNAYANAPVCAPARNTIITGVHACSNGNEQMRSTYLKSETVRFYTEYLMNKGYYCTNNSKTDYNTAPLDLKTMWNECSKRAHYMNRGKDQPFFAIFNIGTSHESSIHRSIPDEQLRHRPQDVTLPPYHPDTPEMRHDWAQYYDKVEDMDAEVGALLKELDEADLKENTIVFYYADHGGVLGRSKRYLYETGTHVPMIIRIPEKYKHLYPSNSPGDPVERLVSFVDLAPTLLSITGTEAPAYMQGDAFLGKYQHEEPEYVYMFRDRMDERYDMTRSIVDRQFRYIRNYNSNRIWMQQLEYLWKAPSMPSWEEEFLAGRCNEVQARFWNTKPVEELYDTENDPWEINNLAADPAYADRLVSMRLASLDMALSMRDAGFIPETDRAIRAGETAIYDYMRSEAVPYEEILGAAVIASLKKPANLDRLRKMVGDDDSAIRYWGVQGLLMLGEDARPALPEIGKAAFDDSWNVSVLGAEILYQMGMKAKAIKAYHRVLECDYDMVRTIALGSIDHIGGSAEEFLDICMAIPGKYKKPENQYDVRALQGLLKKWEIDPATLGI
ncbi:MAG: sulfatase-like hydrolase/transferase [Bacteroidales bacterium]|nr:sulfatase-like hydrolase/transferase [Bacteroidales bacterium]